MFFVVILSANSNYLSLFLDRVKITKPDENYNNLCEGKKSTAS